MMDDEDEMTLVLVAVHSAALQKGRRDALQVIHPQIKPGTAMCAEFLALPKALTMAMDKGNHDLSAMLIEMRDMLWDMRGRAGEAA